MYHVGEESVRGIIIGQVTWPYEFWTEPEDHEPELTLRMTARQWRGSKNTIQQSTSRVQRCDALINQNDGALFLPTTGGDD
jgi:hypothetical protein